jgi:nicotinamide mononucleotide transporter
VSLILEIIAAITTVLSAYYSIYRNKNTWLFGIISCITLSVLYADSKSWYQVIVQVVFVIQSIVGLVLWNKSSNPENRIKRLGIINTCVLLFLINIISGLLYVIIPEFGLIGSYILSYALMANTLLALKYIENWLFWLVFDVSSICFDLYNGLYLTAVMYLVLSVMVISGFINWSRRI